MFLDQTKNKAKILNFLRDRSLGINNSRKFNVKKTFVIGTELQVCSLYDCEELPIDPTEKILCFPAKIWPDYDSDKDSETEFKHKLELQECLKSGEAYTREVKSKKDKNMEIVLMGLFVNS